MARPRKGTVSSQAGKPKPFRLTIGTPNSPGPVKQYVLEHDLRQAIIIAFTDWEPRMRKFDPDAGKQRIMAACDEVRLITPLATERRHIDLDVDDGLVCRAVYWKEGPADAASTPQARG